MKETVTSFVRNERVFLLLLLQTQAKSSSTHIQSQTNGDIVKAEPQKERQIIHKWWMLSKYAIEMLVLWASHHPTIGAGKIKGSYCSAEPSCCWVNKNGEVYWRGLVRTAVVIHAVGNRLKKRGKKGGGSGEKKMKEKRSLGNDDVTLVMLSHEQRAWWDVC